MPLAGAGGSQQPLPPVVLPVAKDVFDRLGAAALLLLAAPWLLLIAAALWLVSDGPVLARDRRVGQWGRYFDLLSFSTPTGGVGAVLRRYNLDDLPRLVNVLTGDMSFVGPRPYAPDDWQGADDRLFLLSVKPGLSRPWPTAPRSPERLPLELDRYLRNWSLPIDLRILRHWVHAAHRSPGSAPSGDPAGR